MSEMKYEDTRGYDGGLGNSNSLDKGNVLNTRNTISDENIAENMARTAVRGDIVNPLSNQTPAKGVPASGAGAAVGAGAVQSYPGHAQLQNQPGYTAVQNPSTHGTVTGLSLSQQQKLLQDMETLQKRLEREMLERRQLETELSERNQKEREHLEEEAKKELERRDSKEIYTTNRVAISNWFLTICYLKIPIINIIYLLCTLISKKVPQPKKAYVLAWAVFQVLCLALAALLIYFVVQFGADFIDNMLKYIPH